MGGTKPAIAGQEELPWQDSTHASSSICGSGASAAVW
eukprot:CAMPEP_0202387908 /NCGR_PEP_ID=MMETSP1127-20130417/74687_1 /ASSEMBLY_ACC=CAM_ASM_000462 /TAXON_ID=3047 /ORGANISM="Dunaliella tertiolecta, Strain CCMP1320" /LENGTH=36 /DNA_ID= /DNA_START= /DNA_END= /DNA_ORIENTATION=